jgi:DegV family protein with EDD domain
MVKVVTDSTADIPTEMVERLGITIVPTYIVFDREAFRDGIDLTKEQFYAKLATSKVLPTTAAASTGTYEAIYGRLAAETDEIVSIQVAANLSAIYNVASTAAESVASATGTRIHVIDSGQVTMGYGWMAVAAAEAAERGAGVDEIVALVTGIKARSHVIAMLDTLEFVYRGGRVSWAQAMIGTLLRVKPMIDVTLGEVRLLERTRTTERAMERLVERIAALGPLERAVVLHANAPALAKRLMAKVQAIAPGWEPISCPAGVTIASHAGPGAVGIACVAAG